jgi:hypothetical protein
MWMNSDSNKISMQATIPEEEDVEDEEMGVAETYADYMPTKCKYFILTILKKKFFYFNIALDN